MTKPSTFYELNGYFIELCLIKIPQWHPLDFLKYDIVERPPW